MTALREALMWFVDHPGECPGDHPKKLEAAREALASETAAPSEDSLDGRRYRYLRDRGCAKIGVKGSEECWLDLNPRDLDLALDAALQDAAPQADQTGTAARVVSDDARSERPACSAASVLSAAAGKTLADRLDAFETEDIECSTRKLLELQGLLGLSAEALRGQGAGEVRMTQEAYEEFLGYRAECLLRQPSVASSAQRTPGIGLVKKMRDERDEIWNAALEVLTHCELESDAETDFERAVIALRVACAKVPSYTQRLKNIFAALDEPEASAAPAAALTDNVPVVMKLLAVRLEQIASGALPFDDYAKERLLEASSALSARELIEVGVMVEIPDGYGAQPNTVYCQWNDLRSRTPAGTKVYIKWPTETVADVIPDSDRTPRP